MLFRSSAALAEAEMRVLAVKPQCEAHCVTRDRD